MVELICIIIGLILGFLPFSKSKKPIKEAEEPKIEIPQPACEMLQAKLTEKYLTLDNYIGQKKGIEYLNGHINKSLENNTSLPHIILWGPGGLGKSTLVKAIANKIGGRFFELVPANLKSTKELFGIFFKRMCSNCTGLNPYSANKCLYCKQEIHVYYTPVLLLRDKDIVFLEECHGLRTDVEEAMYSLMQDKYMVLRFNGIDQKIDFPNITVAGATTRLGDLNKPFRDRFKLSIQLKHYTQPEIKKIVSMYAAHKKLSIENTALDRIASISHGVPRIAKKYIDDSSTLGDQITLKNLEHILSLLEIDVNGLDTSHYKIMEYILMRMKAVKNGGAGYTAIASSTGIPSQIYLEVYEPALLYQGLIFMGSKGRRLTDKAIDLYFKHEKSNIK